MNRLLAIALAVFALALAPPFLAAQQGAGTTAPAAPSAPPAQMQTPGKVGETMYNWTNGMGWMTLKDDESKVAMVVGIEQGLILSVRENWDALPKDSQQTLVKTATRLTVGGVPFNQVVLSIDKLYLDPDNDLIPVVDAYVYAVMELKKASPDQLKHFLDNLRKTYKPPPIQMKPEGK